MSHEGHQPAMAPTPFPSAEPDPRRRVSRRAIATAAAVIAAGAVAGGTALAHAADDGSSATPSTSSAAPSGPGGTSDAGAAAQQAPTPPKHAPHLDGTVTATGDGTITIKDHDGFTRVIRVSASTKYSDGLSATPAAGTEVHAGGTVAADGTSLDATEVGKRPTPPAGGPAGMPGKGPGGKGPEGKGPGGTGQGSDAPAPPTGTAVPQPPEGTGSPAEPGASGGTTTDTPPATTTATG